MAALPAAEIAKTTWNENVYPPSDDSFALVDAVLEQLPSLQLPSLSGVVLEVGCGSGYVICSVALALEQIGRPGLPLIGIDISRHALDATAATLAAHQVPGVELLQADLCTALLPRLKGRIQLLLFNPPYVPTPDEEMEREGIARAWAGGFCGRRVIDQLLPMLKDLMCPGGHVFMVTVPENKPQEILDVLGQQGFKGSIALERAADEECLQILHLQLNP